MSVLRAGVAGLGTMGRHHARVLEAMPGVRLVAACDPNPGAGPAAFGVPVFEDLEQLLALDLDICVVAAPTSAHAAIGGRLAQAGVHALIEKPLAADPDEGRMLATEFERAGLVGCVGHIERFNPVVRAMRELTGRGEIGAVLQIATSRQGPYPQRIRDVGVVLDLASHDFDLTRWIAGSPYLRVAALTNQVIGAGDHEDLAAVVGVLQNGTVVSHLVNWLSPVKERLVTVTGELGCLRGDLLTRTLWLCRHEHGWAGHDQNAAAARGVWQAVPCEFGSDEPLRAELEGFVAAVRGHGDGIVPMRDGAEVMDVATAVLAAQLVGIEVPVASRAVDQALPGTRRAAPVVPVQPGTDGTTVATAPGGAPPCEAVPSGSPAGSAAGAFAELPVPATDSVPTLGSRRFL